MTKRTEPTEGARRSARYLHEELDKPDPIWAEAYKIVNEASTWGVAIEELGKRAGFIEPEKAAEHVCGLAGYGAEGDICPACQKRWAAKPEAGAASTGALSADVR